MTRVRFDFANGWSATLAIREGGDGAAVMHASVVATPAGVDGKPEIIERDASADLVVRALAQVARRRPANVREPSEPIDVDAFARAIAAMTRRAAGVSMVEAIAVVER